MTIQTTLPHDIVAIPLGNHSAGRAGKRVCKITPHHAAMVGATSRQIAGVFTSPARKASSNYCIGNDGSLTLTVGEEDRAWTSSSAANDNQAITIEVGNAAGAPTWQVSDKAWGTLVSLCVDICRRYGFRLSWTGDASGSLTVHRMFAATACPGADLYSKMPRLAQEVNAQLDGGKDRAPIGAFDVLESTIHVSGWCVDPDTPKQPVVLHAYYGSGSTVPDEFVEAFVADQPRPDVAKAYPEYGDRHGFDKEFFIKDRRGVLSLWLLNTDQKGKNPQLVWTGWNR